MGASKEKQNRVMDRGNELSAKERAAQQAAAEQKKTFTKYKIGAVIVLVVAILTALINSSLFDTKLTAVKTGETKWSLAQARYAKQTAYSQFNSNYSGLVSYLIDSDTPLDEQQCSFDSTITWDEYFNEEGLNYLQELAAYYDLAKAEGYTLTEEQQSSIEETITLFETYAKLYGYTTDGYLTAMYGEGNNVKNVKAMMEMNYIGAAYAEDKENALIASYSTEDLDAWYAENADSYNTVSYLYTFVEAEADEEGNVSEDALAAAKATAEAIVDVCDGSVDGFEAAVLATTGLEASEGSDNPASMGEAQDWVKAERKEGDVFAAEEEDGYRVYCYLSTDVNDYKTATIRHILVKTVDADEDGSISDEEKQAAYDTISSIKDQWDGTEDGFAALANQYSEDSGSNSNGGYYEGIYKGQMVSEFDEFCFGGHKTGDTDIVYNETYGYFFIYYVGEGDTYQHVLAKDSLSSADFLEWKNQLLESYPIEKTGLFKKL